MIPSHSTMNILSDLKVHSWIHRMFMYSWPIIHPEAHMARYRQPKAAGGISYVEKAMMMTTDCQNVFDPSLPRLLTTNICPGLYVTIFWSPAKKTADTTSDTSTPSYPQYPPPSQNAFACPSYSLSYHSRTTLFAIAGAL